MADFVSLTTTLDGWFDKPLTELPEAIQERVRQDCFPMPWDGLSAEQRQIMARQWDYSHDPITEPDRQFWWDFFIKKDELEKQIAQWESVATPTAGELAKKERRLKKLNDELACMQMHEKRDRGDLLPASAGAVSATQKDTGLYIAYPKALRRLAERLNAMPEELAAWIFMGPEHGGIAAYRNANELIPPPRFFFDHDMGDDYLAPMMACWFLEQDIERFSPEDRYISGKVLIERWGEQPGIKADAFIQAKIEESRLLDLHPIYGGTRGGFSGNDNYPPLEAGLFSLAHVVAIEAEDFGLSNDEPSQSSAVNIHAVDAMEIRGHFRVVPDPGANIIWWKKMMRDAKRNGLASCRVGEGKSGPGVSLWRPDQVAAWLVDRHGKQRVGLNSAAARNALMKFPGCEEAAESWFPSNDLELP